MTSAATSAEPVRSIAQEKRIAASGWLVAPWFDALFIANVLWPLWLLWQWSDDFSGRAGLQFWQIYFVTTPHRWITLLIVFLDRERFAQRRAAFLLLAAAAVAICVGVRISTGALTCLMALDYLWNAWHFAAQHHGIYRIYARLERGPAPTVGLALEKWSMRFFLLYVILRIVSATWADVEIEAWLADADWAMALVPIGLLMRALLTAGASSRGRLVYLTSVLGLFLCILWAVHERKLGLVLALATASALFHAIEYLALVSWSVQGRHATLADQMGALAYLAPRWGLALAVFVVVLGAGAWFVDQRFVEAWLMINVIVAFLHYAYDGLIWRRR